MSVNLRYPNITGSTEKEQLVQIKSYLHQLVEQLNYALPTYGTGDGSAQAPSTFEVQGGEMSYYELRSLIISTTEELKNQYKKLYDRLEHDYVGKTAFDNLVSAFDELVRSLPESYASKDAFDKATKDIETIQDDIDALEKALDALGAGSKDFVSEVGTTNGWTYRKWNSGAYEMFGAFTVTTTTICTDMGSMFCSEELCIPTPFAIGSAIVSGSADDLFLIASGAKASVDGENNIGFVLLRPFSFDADMEIAVRLHVTGTYNQGGT